MVTYKSGEAETQIDYILVYKNSGIRMINYKVIPGEECLTQHRLLSCGPKLKGLKKNERIKGDKKIKAWKLRDEESVQITIQKDEGGWEN